MNSGRPRSGNRSRHATYRPAGDCRVVAFRGCAKLPHKAKVLSRKLAALLPDIDATPVHVWAGSFGDSSVGTPTIGRIPKMPNCYAAMGYGGNGITFSMMAAQMRLGLIYGYGDANAELVSFYRAF